MQRPDSTYRDFIAWSLVGLLPWLLYAQLSQGLPFNQVIFLCLALAAIVMWIFRLTPDFVPGLALILVVTLLDLVPREVAFSGFYSQVFFLVFGIFVLASLLAETSWLGRLEAVLVNKQASFPIRLIAVVCAGVLLTLVVPSPLGRASMVQPLVQRFFRSGRPRNNAFLAIAHMHGTTLLSTIILTGNPLNFVLLGMLDDQTRDRYHWLGWLQASSVAGLIIAIGFVAALAFFSIAVRRRTTHEVAEVVAKPTASNPLRDWATLGLYGVLLVGILTRSIHQVPLEWIVLSLAMSVFFFSGLSLAALRQRFDWPTLIFVATVVAWGPMLDHLGLSQWLADQLPALVPLFERNLYLGFAVLMAGVFVIRLAVPGAPAFIILASALLPFADVIGISPWVLGFVILTVSEGFIWPYQHGVFSQTVTTLDAERTDYAMSSLIIFNILFFILRCSAVFISIPFWETLNLI